MSGMVILQKVKYNHKRCKSARPADISSPVRIYNMKNVRMPMAKNTKPASTRNVFIVEDHPIFRAGLTQLVNGEPGLRVSGNAATAAKALQDIRRLKPELVLVDIGLPGKNGLELIKALRVKDKKIKLLVISMHDEALYADRVLRAGGDGYVMKQEDPAEIIEAIQDVLAGRTYVSEEVLSGKGKAAPITGSKLKPRPLDHLTDLELAILESLGCGKNDSEIARQLRLAPASVTSSYAQMATKLSLKSVKELAQYAVAWVKAGGS
jgi:DNA-binding NarL/FixJ family response regulator